MPSCSEKKSHHDIPEEVGRIVSESIAMLLSQSRKKSRGGKQQPSTAPREVPPSWGTQTTEHHDTEANAELSPGFSAEDGKPRQGHRQQ
jgi:hypothetical protein